VTQQEVSQQEAPVQEQLALDDARRVKVLSPGMLVFKRFIRNRLAVVGIVILVIMFLFAFLGPLFSPYSIDQIFYKEVRESNKYATGKFNTTPLFIGNVSSSIQSAVLKALGSTKRGDVYSLTAGQEISFADKNEQYNLIVLNPDPQYPTCVVCGAKLIVSIMKGEINFYDPSEVDAELLEVIKEHAESNSKETEIEYGDKKITVQSNKVEKKYFIPSDDPIAVTSFNKYTAINGKVSELQCDTDFLQAVSTSVMSGDSTVQYNGATYKLSGDMEKGFILSGSDGVGLFHVIRDHRSKLIDSDQVDKDNKPIQVSFLSTIEDTDGLIRAMYAALSEDQKSFDFGDETFSIESSATEIRLINSKGELCMVDANSFVPVETKYDSLVDNLEFCYELESAIAEGRSTFDFDSERYTVVADEGDYIVKNAQGFEVLLASNISYGADYVGVELTLDFVRNLSYAMRNQEKKFYFVNQYGEMTEATINVVNENYYVTTEQDVTLIDVRSEPSSEHLLGTEENGMDVLTRLMHGGRVSLLVGFVVVFFEIILGVIIGGISGYFGGVTDTILMRFVELFNAIPFYPTLIIIGSVLEKQQVTGTPRLFMTMAIMGILGWTSIARVVRGQILSLREQDFMIAEEATGIRTSRRI
ncbi:MAG: ABC transporter permease, partial [Bacteroidales bacterium]|nr:ABC transporter permease [Bacteroidales bacterium]